jgi:dTDP-4-dehydrorhamnose 3,5-epimerase
LKFDVIKTNLRDVLVLEPRCFVDERGFFYESFNENDFSKVLGKKTTFVQDNHSLSKRGVLRGLHYQIQQTQGKLVRVVAGSVFDVAVDLRQKSSTFGKWMGVELSAANKKQLWIPEGFAHGFLVLSEEAEFLYKTTDYWHAASEQTILWNDSELNVDWPDIGAEPILNPKDAAGLSWVEAPKF